MVSFPDEKRLLIVRRTVVAGLILCPFFCSKLWLTNRVYPHAPVFDAFPALLPSPFDFVPLVIAAAALLVLLFRPASQRVAAYVYFACLFWLILGDQSRFQPWVYQFTLIVGILAFAPTAGIAVNLCRLVIVGVYFWSGVHKMNFAFLSGTFPWLFQPIIDAVPAAAAVPPLLGPVIPYIELGLALLLLVPRARLVAVVSLVGMHVFILGVLGPWARSWNAVIWPWNVAMMILVPTLFLYCEERARFWGRPHALYAAVVALALVLPSLTIVGWWDSFLSFSLYSGNPVYADLRMSAQVRDRLDPEAQRFARPTGEGGIYLLSVDEWAFDAFDLPAYPTERVLRKIARSFCHLAPEPTSGHYQLELSRGAQWGYREGWVRVVPYGELCSGAPAAIPSR